MATTIPAFAPASPDTIILEAYEKVRANKAWAYSFDDKPDCEVPEGEYNLRDEQQIADENVMHGHVAVTIPGVVARLQEAIPHLDQDRWVDRDLAESGILSLYRQRNQLTGGAQPLVQAAYELLHIEWQRALAAYEKAHDDFDHVLCLKKLVETERLKIKDKAASPFLISLEALSSHLEDRFGNDSEIVALVHTLTPDHEAYSRKVEIIVSEGLEGSNIDVAPWLARDTAFLLGGLDQPMEKAA